jgi:signal transduction histidine kinase
VGANRWWNDRLILIEADHGTEAEEINLMGAVLIVDDSAADRALLRTILGRAGYTVYEVANGGDAVQKAREIRPHIVILDVNLPDLNGLAVCRAIRADAEIGGVPVLMLTVRDDDTDVLAGLEAGADDYVAKDSAGAIVLGRVRRLIEFRQMSSMAMLNQQLVQVGRLLAGIVHEIRGPLAVICGSAELLLYTESPDSENLQWIDAILRNAQLLQLRLDHLVATVRNSSSNVEDVDLPTLLRETVQLFLKGLPPGDRPIQIETACDDHVRAVRIDPGRLMQVLFNLLNNAQQALARLDRGGRIIVRVGTVEEHDQRWVVVDIVDDGPGVPEAFIDRIFEPFFTTRDGGTGYGLYLAAELIREQSGRLTVVNNTEAGATFRIWLPETDSVAGTDAVVRGSTQQQQTNPPPRETSAPDQELR